MPTYTEDENRSTGEPAGSCNFLRQCRPCASTLEASARTNLITGNLYNYCRPVVAHEGPSFVDAKALRHPVLERVDNGVEYVPNDIAIGTDHIVLAVYDTLH